MSQPPPDIATLLRCAQAYSWAGYTSQAEFYSRCADELAVAAPNLEARQLAEACALFGSAGHYHRQFFESVDAVIQQRGLLGQRGDGSAGDGVELFTPVEATLVAGGFSAHLRTSHDALFTALAGYIEREAASMRLADLARCMAAFRRVAVCHDGAIQAALGAFALPLKRAHLLRRPVDGISVGDVATLLECAAYFGVKNDLTRAALQYLYDHVDDVTEASSIKVVYAMAASGTASMNPKLLQLLFRKIGSGSAWESERMRVFHLWISQLLQFPWLEAKLPRRCLHAGLRAWCLHRNGHGCPFPREVRQIASELKAMGVEHKAFVPLSETPYEIDITFGDRKDALIVVSETARNTFKPVGSVLLQIKHMEARGWRVIAIPRRHWLDLGDDASVRRGYLEGKLGRLAPSAAVAVA